LQSSFELDSRIDFGNATALIHKEADIRWHHYLALFFAGAFSSIPLKRLATGHGRGWRDPGGRDACQCIRSAICRDTRTEGGPEGPPLHASTALE